MDWVDWVVWVVWLDLVEAASAVVICPPRGGNWLDQSFDCGFLVCACRVPLDGGLLDALRISSCSPSGGITALTSASFKVTTG